MPAQTLAQTLLNRLLSRPPLEKGRESEQEQRPPEPALFDAGGGYHVEFVGLREHTKRDGTTRSYPAFVSHCIDCGARFEQFATFAVGPSLRRCLAHRSGRKHKPSAYPPHVGDLLRGLVVVPIDSATRASSAE